MLHIKELSLQSWLVGLTMLALQFYLVGGFEYSAYCEKQCAIGRGGNLCRCNAVHFAGKRTLDSGKDSGYGSVYEGGRAGAGYDNNAASRDEVVRLLSYLTRPDRNGRILPASEQALEDRLDNTESMGAGDADNDIPYRSWYRDVKDLLKESKQNGLV